VPPVSRLARAQPEGVNMTARAAVSPSGSREPSVWRLHPKARWSVRYSCCVSASKRFPKTSVLFQCGFSEVSVWLTAIAGYRFVSANMLHLASQSPVIQMINWPCASRSLRSSQRRAPFGDPKGRRSGRGRVGARLVLSFTWSPRHERVSLTRSLP